SCIPQHADRRVESAVVAGVKHTCERPQPRPHAKVKGPPYFPKYGGPSHMTERRGVAGQLTVEALAAPGDPRRTRVCRQWITSLVAVELAGERTPLHAERNSGSFQQHDCTRNDSMCRAHPPVEVEAGTPLKQRIHTAITLTQRNGRSRANVVIVHRTAQHM